MKDIILPITCYQIRLWTFILFGITAVLSLILAPYHQLAGLALYGYVGTILFGIMLFVSFMIAWDEDKLPRFPIRCRCD